MILTKIAGGAAVLLLIACGALWVVNGRIMDANASLKAEKSIMEATLNEQEERMKNLILEKEVAEKALSKRLETERVIRAKKDAELKEMSQTLTQLRKDHENIKEFLAIRVPDEFIDWMRRSEVHNENKNNVSAGLINGSVERSDTTSDTN